MAGSPPLDYSWLLCSPSLVRICMTGTLEQTQGIEGMMTHYGG